MTALSPPRGLRPWPACSRPVSGADCMEFAAAYSVGALLAGVGAWKFASGVKTGGRAAALRDAPNIVDVPNEQRVGRYLRLRGSLNYPANSGLAPEAFASSVERRYAEMFEQCRGLDCQIVERQTRSEEPTDSFVVRVWERGAKYHVLVEPEGLDLGLLQRSRQLLYRGVTPVPGADEARKINTQLSHSVQTAGVGSSDVACTKLADVVNEWGLVEADRVNVVGHLQRAPEGSEVDYVVRRPASPAQPYVLTTGSLDAAIRRLQRDSAWEMAHGVLLVGSGVATAAAATWLRRRASQREE